MEYRTNKILIRVSRKAPFYALHAKCFPHVTLGDRDAEEEAKSQRELYGYYLADVPIPGECVGDAYNWCFDHIIDAAPKILKSELFDLGIPESEWPDVHSRQVFHDFFEYDFGAIIADFGSKPLETFLD